MAPRVGFLCWGESGGREGVGWVVIELLNRRGAITRTVMFLQMGAVFFEGTNLPSGRVALCHFVEEGFFPGRLGIFWGLSEGALFFEGIFWRGGGETWWPMLLPCRRR